MAMAALQLFIDIFILIPLACIIQTVVSIIWFWRLYSDSRHDKEQTMSEMSRVRALSNSSHIASSKNELSSDESTKEQPPTPDIMESKSDAIPSSPPDIITAKSDTEQSSKTGALSVSTKYSNKHKTKPSPESTTKGSLSKLQPIQKWLTSLSFIFAFLYCWCSMVYVIIIVLFPNITDTEDCMLLTGTIMFAFWQRFTLYTYFMIRTYYLFKSSVHQISYNRMKCYSITVFIIYIVESSIWCITAYYDGCIEGMIFLIGTLAFFTEMTFSLLALKLCVNRLIKLYHASKEMANEKDKRTQKHLDKLIRISTKLTVLTLAAVISTNTNVIIAGPLGLISGTVLDTVFNAICLLLSFIVFERQYKCLCKYCDICMFNCCKNHTRSVNCCCCVTV